MIKALITMVITVVNVPESRSVLFPGSVLEALTYVLLDPQDRYGGRLIGTYELEGGDSLPAATISERAPNVKSRNGLELVIDPVPNDADVSTHTCTNVIGNWCAWISHDGQQNGKEELTAAYIRMIAAVKRCSLYYIPISDALDCYSQFKIVIPFETAVDPLQVPQCLTYQITNEKIESPGLKDFIASSELFNI